ncbi:MAG: hypothetical protein K0R71_1403 [Bacillales bacterium]|jgi:outer membrane protein assembly factor BamD (BamD/ComL family)|nr:hypothetical protein [Bacillales bacterium]
MSNIKTFVFVVIVFVLCILLPSNKNENPNKKLKESTSQNKEYEEILITLLLPSVQKAVDEFYSPYLTNNPMVMPYDMKIKNVYYVQNDYTNFIKYIVTVETNPFLGPHRYIGKEKIVLNISAGGEVSVKKYEHLRSNEIFPLDKPLFKKPLPRK